MITLATAFLTIASLTNYNIDTYCYLYNNISISDISANENKIQFEFDSEYFLTLETNLYSDFSVADEELIGSELFNIYIDIEEPIQNLTNYRISLNTTYQELILNIDSYTINFDIDIDIIVYSVNTEYYGFQSVSRTITMNTAEQFTMQETFELQGVSTSLTCKPQNLDNTIYKNGYDKGVETQVQSENIWKLFDAIFNVTNNILSIEILPGIRLWYLVGIPVFFLLLQFVLNLFR